MILMEANQIAKISRRGLPGIWKDWMDEEIISFLFHFRAVLIPLASFACLPEWLRGDFLHLMDFEEKHGWI